MTTTSSTTQYLSKTQHYQRVQKPLLERQRRARINKCLDALKQLIAEFQSDDAILRMDKAEMLETTIAFMRTRRCCSATSSATTTPVATTAAAAPVVVVDSFRHGYMNAVNEVSRVLASTPGMNIELGKSVMTHLGRVYNRLQQQKQQQQQQQHLQQEKLQHQKQQQQQQQVYKTQPLSIDCSVSSMTASLSPASSGYHSDYESPVVSPVAVNFSNKQNNVLWRPW